MSKRWADQDSSDEGSVEPEDEEVELEQPQQNTQQPHYAYVSSIPASSTKEELTAFFEGKNCKILSMDGRPSAADGRFLETRIGFGEVLSLENCLRANGELFRGHHLKVSQKYEPYFPQQQHQHGGRAVGGGGRGGGRNDYKDRADRRGPGRDDSRDRDRDFRGGRGGGRGSREVSVSAPKDPSPPATRKKIVLAPRTLPVETIGKPVVVKADIFGGGKPHDEAEYEELKKKLVAETKDASTPAPVETVFKMETLKVTAPEDDPVSEGGVSEPAPKGRGHHSAGGRGEKEKWREGGGGSGRGGRGGEGRGRGGGRGAPRSSGPPAAAGAGAGVGCATGISSVSTTGTGDADSSHVGYVVEKPKEEFNRPHGSHGNTRPTGSGREVFDGSRKPRGDRGDGGAGGRGSRGSGRPGSGVLKSDQDKDKDKDMSSSGAGTAAPNRGSRGKGGNNPADMSGKLFTDAARDAFGSSKPSKAPATQLTDEEKFVKAQDRFGAKDKSSAGSGTGSAPGKSKKSGGLFAVLNESDSENE